jgi:hypothetical protein
MVSIFNHFQIKQIQSDIAIKITEKRSTHFIENMFYFFKNNMLNQSALRSLHVLVENTQ